MNDCDKAYQALSKIAETANAALAHKRRSGNIRVRHDHGHAGHEMPSCSIKLLPERLRVPAAETAIRKDPANGIGFASVNGAAAALGIHPLSITLMVSKYWGRAQRQLTVSFIEQPESELRARILSHMNIWSTRCGVSFIETQGVGQVRISLQGAGYWSYLGTDILHIPENLPTMNLQDFSMSTPESEYHRVVRHETGHTLGFAHEHMRQELVERIDPEKAYDYFLRTQGWDKKMVDMQVLTPLNKSDIMGTPADQTSIMCYQLPSEITKDGEPIVGGLDVNETDFGFAAKIYPKSATPGQQSAGAQATPVDFDDWPASQDVEVDA